MDKPKLSVVDGTTAEVPNPFDIAKLRLNPSFVETAGVKKRVMTVPVKKPSKQDFIRVRPEPEFRENFAMIDLKDDREDYLVVPELYSELAASSSTRRYSLPLIGKA